MVRFQAERLKIKLSLMPTVVVPAIRTVVVMAGRCVGEEERRKMASPHNPDEVRNAELRARRDNGYGAIVVAPGDTNAATDRAHSLRVINDEIRARKGTL